MKVAQLILSSWYTNKWNFVETLYILTTDRHDKHISEKQKSRTSNKQVIVLLSLPTSPSNILVMCPKLHTEEQSVG